MDLEEVFYHTVTEKKKMECISIFKATLEFLYWLKTAYPLDKIVRVCLSHFYFESFYNLQMESTKERKVFDFSYRKDRRGRVGKFLKQILQNL